jgi:hypothetical protein
MSFPQIGQNTSMKNLVLLSEYNTIYLNLMTTIYEFIRMTLGIIKWAVRVERQG